MPGGTITKDQHHPFCSTADLPREGCQHCGYLHATYPVREGETAAEATARYFPQAASPALAQTAPKTDLVLIKPGRPPMMEATAEMVEAHIQVQDALDDLEIFLRQERLTIRRPRPRTEADERRDARKADEDERIEAARATLVRTEQRRTSRFVMETDGHRRLVRRVKTTAGQLEKNGKLTKELAQHLTGFAHLVADGMGAATEDEHDSTNRLTGPYQPVATLSGFSSKTPSDRMLQGLRALQEMRSRIPAELMPVFDQIIEEEVIGNSPLARTLAELGEALGYKHKQASSAGGAVAWAVTCLIAHYMRGGHMGIQRVA